MEVMMSLVHQQKVKIWEARFESFKTFPGTIESFCKTEKIAVSAFYKWRQKLSPHVVLKRRKKTKSRFLPVVVSEMSARPVEERNHLPEARWVAEVMLHLVRGCS